MSSDSARLGVNIDSETKRRVRIEAAKRDTTMSGLARDVIEDWIEEQDDE